MLDQRADSMPMLGNEGLKPTPEEAVVNHHEVSARLDSPIDGRATDVDCHRHTSDVSAVFYLETVECLRTVIDISDAKVVVEVGRDVLEADRHIATGPSCSLGICRDL